MDQPVPPWAVEPAGVREFLLAFADDEHLIGQQHTEWIGVAPFLEEDLAFSSIGQDELGHAALLYELVLELDGVESSDETIDALAYNRFDDNYRSCHLVEFTTTDWTLALVRHWIYDTFEQMRWQLVAESSLPGLSVVAERAMREEAYHRMHADALLDRLLEVDDARQRIVAGVDELAPLVAGLCEPPAGESMAIAQAVCSGSMASLAKPLKQAIRERFGVIIDFSEQGTQNRRTTRSPHFAPLMSRMREVLDYDPQARW